jgi:hypothetical protein
MSDGYPALMTDRVKTARNIAIVALIAAAVYLLPSGGQVAHTFEALLYVGFGVAIGYLGLRLYREHRVALYSLGDRDRGLLYGSVAGGLFVYMARVYMARVRMWQTGIGELLWFVLVGGIVYALIVVFRRWRTYWGSRRNASTWVGRSMAKCLWSRVASLSSPRRSVSASTLASTTPSD